MAYMHFETGTADDPIWNSFARGNTGRNSLSLVSMIEYQNDKNSYIYEEGRMGQGEAKGT